MVSITFQPTTEDIILFVGGGEVAERRMQLFIEEKNIACGPTAVMIRARVALLCRHPLNSAIFILLLVPIM